METIKKGITAVVVGPNPDQLNYPDLEISKRDDEVTLWVAKKKTDRLRIEFEDEIFEGMTPQKNRRWVPAGGGTSRVCYSGEIKETITADPTKLYKYWQILIDKNNNEREADGRIIINP